MSRTVYVNGQYLPEEQGKISIFDRGFLFADGVYEVTAVVHGRLIDYEPHIERLERSLSEIRMAWPCSKPELR
ncbi:MAG: D-amino acid aminotransferase, partial [Hyphomicrobiales bacterium]